MEKKGAQKKRKRTQSVDNDTLSQTKSEEHKKRKTSDTSDASTTTASYDFAYSAPSVSHVKDKIKRRKLNAELRHVKNVEKRKRKEKRKKDVETLGDAAPAPPPQRTLENTREPDDTMVKPDDEEVKEDTAVDEFAEYFANKTTPKILITTSPNICKRAKETIPFINDLISVIPNMTYRERRNFTLKEIVQFCKDEGYTDVIVINEDRKQPNSLLLSHLPNGPTVLFKLTSIILQKHIHNHARATEHFPELILNNFNTRLGHTVGRMLAALLPQSPEFPGRRVMTFHNQRDFIFFRQHRYIFDSEKKARLQEIGPRFTLKLKYVQHGTFDSKFGEYEWLPKKELVTSRRRFFM